MKKTLGMMIAELRKEQGMTMLGIVVACVGVSLLKEK